MRRLPLDKQKNKQYPNLFFICSFFFCSFASMSAHALEAKKPIDLKVVLVGSSHVVVVIIIVVIIKILFFSAQKSDSDIALQDLLALGRRALF